MQTRILKLTGTKSFSILAGINRPINPKQVTKLSESINKMGIIRPVVVATISFITGAPKTYIIDGQHLFHACIRNKVDVPYVEIEIKDLQDLVEKIALLNSSSKSWTTTDYILSWSSVHEDYKKLAHYIHSYSFETRSIASILSGIGNNGVAGGVNKFIRTGKFCIKNEKGAATLLNYLTEIDKAISFRTKKQETNFNSVFNLYYKRIITTYNHTSFLKFCNVYKTQLQKCVLAEEFNQILYKYQRI